jgi:hypothetical protein
LAMGGEVVSRGLQTVMHMDCSYLPWPLLGTCQQQSARVGPAAQSNRKRQGR